MRGHSRGGLIMPHNKYHIISTQRTVVPFLSISILGAVMDLAIDSLALIPEAFGLF